MTAFGRDREVATEPGSSHSGRGIALAYGGYLCSRQTGATGHEQSLGVGLHERSSTACARKRWPLFAHIYSLIQQLMYY